MKRFVLLACSLLVIPGVAIGVPIPPGGTFTDDDGNVHEATIESIAYEGITLGCGERLYCPSEGVTRAQMASFLVRAFELPASATDYFSDDNNSIHEANINALRAAEITLGCDTTGNLYCPGDVVSRAQMASFLVRAIGLEDGAGDDLFVDDDGTTHENNIDRLGTAGITLGCGPPENDMFCPDDDVRRDQMASFLSRGLELTPLVAPSPSQGWSRAAGGDANATPALTADRVIGGSSAGMFATTRSGVEVWTNGIGIDFSSPLVQGGLVIVGSTDGNVYGLDLADGTIEWSYDTGSLVNSSPVVYGDDVFIGSSFGSIYSLDAATGTFNWAFSGGVFFSSPVVVEGVVYVGSQDNQVYAVDVSTGLEVWSFATGGTVLSSPTVADGILYIGSHDSKLYAIDVDSGLEVWSATLGGAVRSSPAVADGIVVVGANDSKVHAFDALTGDALWSYSTGDWVEASPTIDLGAVFIPSNDGNLYVLRLSDGQLLWSEWLSGPIRSAAAVDGRLVVVGVSGSIDGVATISY